MSISKKKDRITRTEKARGPQPSYFPQVVTKFQKIPEYKELSSIQLSELVNRLSTAEGLISYFDLSQDAEGASAEVDTLPVELVLKYLLAKPDGIIESTLLEEYGPLHANIVIGDQILEWNWKSVVIPHGKPMQDVTGVHPHPMAGDAFGVRECELPCVKTELLKAKVLAEVANYNKRCYYDTIRRNSHDFVCSTLSSMNLDKPPQLNSKIKDYYGTLVEKKRDFIPTEFNTHDDLDGFVANNMTRLNNIEKEYLIFHYFILHLNAIMQDENPLKWACQEPNCKIVFLEQDIPEKLILHRFKTVKYNFQQSTAL